jgi:hypothetical protein
MKVFWKRETWAAAVPGNVERVDEEEMEFAGELFGALERALEESQGWMPGCARRFQGWEVGLLERFDVREGVGLDGGKDGGGKDSEVRDG